MVKSGNTSEALKLASAKLQGGALYIAIIVSIIIGILLSLFIVLSGYNQRQVTSSGQMTQLYYNLQSAVELAQSDRFSEALNNSWIKNAVNDDSIKIKRQLWGAYFLLVLHTKNRHQQLSRSGLYGMGMTGDSGLVVPDNGRPVSLCGNVVFNAGCYLPKAGIKPAYVEGRSYNAAPQNSSFIRTASAEPIPMVSQVLLKGLQDQQNSSTNDSSAFIDTQADNPFYNKTLVWAVPGGTLSGLQLSNNIKITGGNISIDSSCHFNNILLVCKKAHFKKGFRGRVHVIASDSIVAEEKCRFDFPSSFALLPGEGTGALCYIQLAGQCRFFGGIVAVNPEPNSALKTKVMVRLQSGCEVNGLVYSGDYAQVQGQVNATVLCNKLLLKTASAAYENHLLDCVIDPKKYAASLSVPQLFGAKTKLMCCETIN